MAQKRVAIHFYGEDGRAYNDGWFDLDKAERFERDTGDVLYRTAMDKVRGKESWVLGYPHGDEMRHVRLRNPERVHRWLLDNDLYLSIDTSPEGPRP